MAKTKKKTSQLLALFMSAVLVFSSFSSVAVAATTAEWSSSDRGINTYTKTDSLAADDKADSTQQNVQSSSDITDLTYSESLLQSAEWTNKDAGTANINIHYKADFGDEVIADTRSLYVYTNCNAHGFSVSLAAENIYGLLQISDYVDVIVLAVKHDGSSLSQNNAVVMTFSVCAEDFETMEESAATTAIKTILNANKNETLAQQEKAYALGATRDSNSSGTIEVLYKGDSATDDDALTASYLPELYGGHLGVYFSIYYIQKYFEIIEHEDNYGEGSFNSVVRYIINSFDNLLPAIRNCYSDTNKNNLYTQIKDIMGVDLASDSFSLESLRTDYADAIDAILEYDEGGRYVALVANSLSGYGIDSYLPQQSRYNETGFLNEISYLLFLMDPTGTWDNEDTIKAEFKEYLSGEKTYTFSPSTYGAWSYGTDLNTLDILSIDWDTKYITITATITSEFEIDTSTGITVKNVGENGTTFDYDVTTDASSGNTIVTIELTNLANKDQSGNDVYGEVAVDISIPVKLKDNTTEFRDSEDWFKDTNAADTRVTVWSPNTNEEANDYVYEIVTVASPKLYKAYGNLTISKKLEGAGSSTTDEFEFTVTLNGISAEATYTTTYPDGETGTITFDSSGQVTGMTKDSVSTGKTTITLKGDETFTISGLPAGATYTVTETASDYTVYEVSSKDSNDNTVGTTIISGNSISNTIIANDTITTTFTNYRGTGDLTISKTVSGSGASTTQKFAFTITLDDISFADTYTASYSNSGETSIKFDTEGKATVSLADGESVTIYGIPEGVGYSVTESSVANYTTTSTVSVEGVDGSTEYGNTASGTIVGNKETTVAFDNKRASADTESGGLVEDETTTSNEDTTDSSDDSSDDATTDETDDDDAAASSILAQTGASIGALLLIVALVALGACAIATLAAFALRKRRTF